MIVGVAETALNVLAAILMFTGLLRSAVAELTASSGIPAIFVLSA